jgi:hypothetical protein
MYLHAEWMLAVHDYFDLGIRILRLDRTTRDVMRSIVANNGGHSPGEYVFEEDVQWVVALHLEDAAEHVPRDRIGMSFRELVEQSVLDQFLTCLRLLKATCVVCPVRFQAALSSEGIVAGSVIECDDYQAADYNKPPGEWEEAFHDDDLHNLARLWPALVQFRRLESWIHRIFQESFFAKLDAAASKRTSDEMRRLFKDRVPRESVTEWVKSGAAPIILPDLYNEKLREAYSDEKAEVFADRTRLGRAIDLFINGLHLPPLHAFLSMCLALETLYTTGQNEVTHKLTTRLTKIVDGGGTMAERKKRYRLAKDVYNARSQVAHGSTTIDGISPEARRGAFDLARLSMRSILLDPELLRMFSNGGGGPNGLDEFFLSLDLGIG